MKNKKINTLIHSQANNFLHLLLHNLSYYQRQIIYFGKFAHIQSCLPALDEKRRLIIFN